MKLPASNSESPGLLLAIATAILALVLLAAPKAKADTLSLPAGVPVDAGPLGTLKVQGMVSGLAVSQSDALASDQSQRFNVDNAQFILQKDTGTWQFLIQGGAYTFPVVGVPIADTSDVMKNLYGPIPVAYVKWAPSDSLSVQMGKMATLVGAEGAWPWGNYDIQRGLLWNLENTVARSAQLNYSRGAFSSSLAWTDGFYSHRFNNFTGLFSFAIDAADTFSLVVYDTLGHTPYGSTATPEALNNSRTVDFIYTRNAGDWTFTPYLQYVDSPASSELGYVRGNSSIGAALLADYTLSSTWSLGGRVEYVTTTDNPSDNANLLGYGPGSRAWTLTLTPTWQSGGLFARSELSYVHVSGFTPGLAFGATGDRTSQLRALLEAGVVF